MNISSSTVMELLMLRQILFFLVLVLILIPFPALAIETPPGQTRIGAENVLRGNFVHEIGTKATQKPWRTTGHFVVAPAQGLIWSVEKPFPTQTIVTPAGAAQQIAGVNVTLPIRNLRSLYDVVSGALAGDWSKLEKGYLIKKNASGRRWTMLLTPRENAQLKLPYTQIEISGGPYVEKIFLTKSDGNYDAIAFSEETLSVIPLTATENSLLNKDSLSH